MFYGWWLVGVAGLMLTLMSVTVFQGIGTFFVALERYFGWNRTVLSGAFALSRAEGAIFGPLEGVLVDKLGTRRMVLVGFSLMGIGFIGFSMVQNVWQFYAVFFLISFGSGLGGWLPMVSLVNNWFVRKRALALAGAVTGIHLGGFLVPLLAFGVESTGFRATTFSIGIFLLVIVFPVTRLIRNRPEEYGLLPDGTVSIESRGAAEADRGVPEDYAVDFTVRQAVGTLAFWAIAVARFTSVAAIISLSVHLIPKLTDTGMSLVTANFVVLAYTALAMPSQFVAGYIADRLSKPLVLFVLLLLQAAGIMVLAYADDLYLALVFAVLYGIGFGGRIPLLTAIVGDYFGRKSFGAILGFNTLPSNIAMIGAPLFAGYMFDLRQSYFVPFMTFAVMGFVGALAILLARKPDPQPRQPAR